MISVLSLYNSKLGFQQRLAMELLSMRLKVGVGAAPWQWGDQEAERPPGAWETDEKGKPLAPYTCPDCGKSYMWKQGLNTHKRLHCGKEPRFQCPYCPKRCYQRGNLDSHIRNVHANLLQPSSEILCKEEVKSSSELKN
ncbi:zinc finger protein 775-like isoform X1 [Macrosteles quadrilineatus]|uniref:zinc finger protein 775-like isoform X1 n=1 Tax=Macrosteles quadrilineatus TaxID=74068 RepID=UPI0023E202E8|nr:zinc finger protein 775-like isoform X1 [Macrosteles quadrilineatus]